MEEVDYPKVVKNLEAKIKDLSEKLELDQNTLDILDPALKTLET